MLERVKNKVRGVKPPPLADYRFSVDVVEPKVISGWAKNIKLPNHTPVIDVYGNGTLIWQAHANQNRADLAEKGIGDFAFTLIPDPSVLTEPLKEIDICIDGHKIDESPFALKMSVGEVNNSTSEGDEKAVQESESKLPPIEDIVCHVDAVTENGVRGWAKLNGVDDHRVSVELKANDLVIASGNAEGFREDIMQAGIGDGCYAFDLAFDLASFPASRVEAQVAIDGVLVPDSMLDIQVQEHAILQAKFLQTYAPQVSDLSGRIDNELARLESSIDTVSNTEPTLVEVVQLTLQNVAELQARTQIMEEVLLKLAQQAGLPESK